MLTTVPVPILNTPFAGTELIVILKVSPSTSVGAAMFNAVAELSSVWVDELSFATGSSFTGVTVIVCVAVSFSPDGSVTV